MCRDNVQRRRAREKHSGERENDSGRVVKTVRLPARNVFRLQPGIAFTFTPECFSRSSRNRFHLAPESALDPPMDAEVCRLPITGSGLSWCSLASPRVAGSASEEDVTESRSCPLRVTRDVLLGNRGGTSTRNTSRCWRFGCLPERVRHGITGFVVPDRQSFPEATITLLRDDSLWKN